MAVDVEEFMKAYSVVFSNKEIRDDFMKFNDEIDRVKEEEGLSEQDAVNKVSSYWDVKGFKDFF